MPMNEWPNIARRTGAFTLLAISVAAPLAILAQSNAPATEKAKPIMITLSGTAQNGKMFAELRTETATVPISNLEVWPNGVEGMKVEVRGNYRVLPQPPMDPNVPTQGFAQDIRVFIVDEWKILR